MTLHLCYKEQKQGLCHLTEAVTLPVKYTKLNPLWVTKLPSALGHSLCPSGVCGSEIAHFQADSSEE